MSLECAGTETELVRSVTFPAADLQTGNEVNVRRQITTVCVDRVEWGVNVHLVNTFLSNLLYTLSGTLLYVLKHLKLLILKYS